MRNEEDCVQINYLVCLREAFKIFDRDKDGFISMKELKKVANMLGTMLTKEELDDFMAEADSVCNRLIVFRFLLINLIPRMGMENWIMMSLLR